MTCREWERGPLSRLGPPNESPTKLEEGGPPSAGGGALYKGGLNGRTGGGLDLGRIGGGAFLGTKAPYSSCRGSC